MSPGIKRNAGIGFVAVIAGLLAFNVYVLARNAYDHRFARIDRFAVRPTSIAQVARQNTMETVRTTFAAYHRMRELLAGTHLLLPARLEAHKFALERVSRIDVAMSTTQNELPSAAVSRLFDIASTTWSMEPANLTGVILEPGATRYVMVTRNEDYGLLMIITEQRYQQELLAAGKAP
jgi:hypothetical protein